MSPANETQLAVRVPEELLGRIDSLAGRLSQVPEYQAWRMTRSAVIRLILIQGLEQLEKQYPPGEPPAPPKKKH